MDDVLVLRGSLAAPITADGFVTGQPFAAIVIHLEPGQPQQGPRRARLLSSYRILRVREMPDTAARIVDSLGPDDRPEILEERVIDGDIWWRIGLRQWIARKKAGIDYLEIAE